MRFFKVMVMATLIGVPAMAQEVVQPSVTNGAWNVYQTESGNGRVCWAASAPEKSEARRAGRTVSVNRGQITLNVAARPGSGVRTEISVLMGYPLREGSEVELTIGSAKFSLFTEGETAWSRPADDQAIVDAFRRGSNARAVGVSSRGTTTIDTFSLMGFTASLEGAQGLCR